MIMGCSPAKFLGIVAMTHTILGVLSVVFGIIALKVAPHYSSGVFGMGIWLGGWMLITGLSGLLSAHCPKDFCKLGGFIGCCLVGTVTMIVCSIILGVGVLKYFVFESTVTREYYKEYDFAKYTHEDYFKPQKYFDERNRKGQVGCVIYGSLVCIMILDVIASFASCCAGRVIINEEHVNITRTSQRGRSRQIPESTTNRGRAVFITHSPRVNNGLPLQDDFVEAPYYPGPKLPNYLDIYPEGSAAWQSPQIEAVQPDTSLGPPPEYTPSATNPTNGVIRQENQTNAS